MPSKAGKSADSKGNKGSKALAKTDDAKKKERAAREIALSKIAEKGWGAVEKAAGASTFEDGGGTIVEKEDLEGVPFAIMTADFHDGDHGTFVSLCCMLKHSGELVIVNDGSTGIKAQVEEYLKEGGKIDPEHPFIVPGGTRVSRYTYEDKDGKEKPAETWYLSGRKSKGDVEGLRTGGKNGASRRRGAGRAEHDEDVPFAD